ncbi:hypothetical protein [Bradyrhizobium sp. JYMT SZCCT0428]|uniref:hypothetical protein n=1 Tax=Bradyrhizobium sp. JYMT SZCCT0428 TaxID=2807673 RepID=UPI001BA6FC56|nr:hypothetical protein [Bradyrhizobium sp. JYMT SZCCT0428]MBR1150476.1 hypothetical protein [Bradyrhizobium sp. JYMT SZCCT0428]
MIDRPASWPMPTPKQMEKLAAEAVRIAASHGAAPDLATPAQYWDATLKDPRAETNGLRLAQRHLSEIRRHVLRVSCRRCERTVEIQTADAVRLYGGNAVWKDVAQRLLDNICQQRTGRLEEDGCWPAFDAT